MNKNIKNAIELATLSVEPNDPEYCFVTFDKEMFAQAIILECATFCKFNSEESANMLNHFGMLNH